MRQYPLNRWVAGTYKKECARCGWDYLRSELQRDPNTNSLVCFRCIDPPKRVVKARKETDIKIE